MLWDDLDGENHLADLGIQVFMAPPSCQADPSRYFWLSPSEHRGRRPPAPSSHLTNDCQTVPGGPSNDGLSGDSG